MIVLGEDDGRKTDTDNPNDEITRVWREQFQMNRPLTHKHSAGNDGRGDNDSVNRTDSINRTELGKTIMSENMNGDCAITEHDCDIVLVEDSGDRVLQGKSIQKDDLSADIQTQSTGR